LSGRGSGEWNIIKASDHKLLWKLPALLFRCPYRTSRNYITTTGKRINIFALLNKFHESSLIFLLRAHALFSLLHSSPQAANTTYIPKFCPN
jgi:hypothetical protein